MARLTEELPSDDLVAVQSALQGPLHELYEALMAMRNADDVVQAWMRAEEAQRALQHAYTVLGIEWPSDTPQSDQLRLSFEEAP